jgi:hypothetical protein
VHQRLLFVSNAVQLQRLSDKAVALIVERRGEAVGLEPDPARFTGVCN